MRQAFTLAALALVAGMAGFMAYRLWDPAPSPVGQLAPALALRDATGQEHSLAALRGKWVLVNFWASWCAPCMDELPLLVDAQRRYASRGLQILGPALDDADAIAPVVARFGINYPVMPDFVGADAAMQALGNTQGALPYSVLVDPQGIVVDRVLGGLSRAALESLITANIEP